MLLTLKKFFSQPAFIFVILASCIAGFALLHSGLPPTHDGEYHVIRFYEFDKVLRDGNWYPRWAPDLNNGYGVPLFNYVYPLPNYITSFFHLFGISFIDAFKLNMFFATIIGGIFFYLWTKRFWGVIGGLVSSIFYTFSPYHFVDIYIRGSVGEVWALAFFPAFLWSLTVFLQKKKTKFIVLAGVFLALIIFSHNILALMFFPFALSYIAFLLFKERNNKYLILNTLYLILLGVGLSAIFWIPALFEQHYVTGLQIYNVEKNFPEFYQLLIPSWGSGFSEGALENQMSFQIGIANLGAILFSFFTIVVFYKKKDKHFAVLAFSLCWFFLVLFLLLKISLGVWQKVPFMDYFQFPWRFLSLAILIASFSAGSVSLVWRSKILAGFFIVLAILLSIGYTKPAYYHNRNDNYYITRSNFIDGTNSPGNYFNTIWMHANIQKQQDKLVLSKEDGEILFKDITSTEYRFNLALKKDTHVLVSTSYFPGWKAFVDKKEVKIVPDRNGLISFRVPAGTHAIKTQFKNTPIRSFGAILSIVSFLAMFLYPAFRYRGIISLA